MGAFTVEPLVLAERAPFSRYTYRIFREGRLVAHYWHDYRGDEHVLEPIGGSPEPWPVGRMVDFLTGGGPEPLALSAAAEAHLEALVTRGPPSLGARLALARPTVARGRSYLGLLEEMRALGETIWPSREPAPGEDFARFGERALAREVTHDAHLVPESVYWAVVDDEVVGVIALRHRLTDQLARFGGHVGYEVRPSWRRRGVATAMLRALLATERARDIGRLLVTCAPSNVGSRRAIEACGGVLDGIVYVEEVARDTCHYWIEVP